MTLSMSSVAAFALTTGLALCAPVPAHAIVFSNTAPISIPTTGTATLYPSTINVSGVTGTVTNLTVTLTGYSHTFTDDVDVLLVGPQGQNVALMFGAGDSITGTTASNINLTFSDAAQDYLPDETGVASLPSGTYRPSNFYTNDTLSSPAPAGPYGSALSAFNVVAANGIWSLYVQDFGTNDGGSISGGWSIDVTVAMVVPEPASITLLGLGALPLAGMFIHRRLNKQ